MPKPVSYQKAVVALSKYIDHHHAIDAFDASIILAYMFKVSKEKALDDLITYRSVSKVGIVHKQNPVFGSGRML